MVFAKGKGRNQGSSVKPAKGGSSGTVEARASARTIATGGGTRSCRHVHSVEQGRTYKKGQSTLGEIRGMRRLCSPWPRWQTSCCVGRRLVAKAKVRGAELVLAM